MSPFHHSVGCYGDQLVAPSVDDRPPVPTDYYHNVADLDERPAVPTDYYHNVADLDDRHVYCGDQWGCYGDQWGCYVDGWGCYVDGCGCHGDDFHHLVPCVDHHFCN